MSDRETTGGYFAPLDPVTSLAELREHFAAVVEQRDAAQARAETAERERDRVVAALASMNIQRDAALSQLSTLKAQLAEAQAQLETWQKSTVQNILDNRVLDLEQQNYSLKTQLAEAQKERDGEAFNVSALIEDRNELLRRLSEVRDALRQQTEALRKERDKWQRRFEEKDKPARVIAESLEQARQRVAELEAALRDCSPAHVWDMARQYYTDHESNSAIITAHHHKLCEQARAALASTAPQQHVPDAPTTLEYEGPFIPRGDYPDKDA